MERERIYQQFGERSGEAGSAAKSFTAFIDKLAPSGERTQREERGLQLADPFTPFSLMHKVKERSLGFRVDDLGFEPTEEQAQMIEHVKLAYGIIAYPFCETKTLAGEPSPIYQKTIEYEVALDRVYEGNIKVVLTDEEREILVKIANSAGVPCDPERNEYFYDEILRMTLEEEGFIRPNVVDAGK
jgi:hypothetical protein